MEEIDVRLAIPSGHDDVSGVLDAMMTVPGVFGVVLLRPDGYGHSLPVEDTRRGAAPLPRG